MNLTNISGIRTTEDLQAQAAGQTSELDRNAFLKLFTTQLQNQDPLDPVKNEAFIAQLAQFSTLEATTSMSDSLQEFVADQRGDGLMRGAALIGKSVFMQNGAFEQPGGETVEGYLQLDSGADDVVLNVVDTLSGKLINQMSLGPQMAGEVPFAWNGGDFGGKAAEPGRYAFIAQAVRDGKSASVDSFAATRVTGVSWDQNSGKAFLELAGGKPILLETVKRIAQ
jgi:flagellar basal-body rod modification protein FlgD